MTPTTEPTGSTQTDGSLPQQGQGAPAARSSSGEFRRCSRCVMDSAVPEIRFDANGMCQFCEMHDLMELRYPLTPGVSEKRLLELAERIKEAGKGKPYDCVCGVSGGRDSTWTLYTVNKLGLRPLAVHFDNGWNSTVAVTNIKNACDVLKIDLETVVADWDEFRDLQVAFLKASVPDVEIPTDVAIHSVLHKIADQEGIKYVMNGHSFRTEGIAPKGWTYMDGRYIEDVQRRFGTRSLRDFKNFSLQDFVYYSFVKRIQVIPILNYSVYDQKQVNTLLEREMGWTYYGGHHHESTYTAFIQSYLLPRKFNVDKRKTECSALIRSGQMTRQEALDEVDGKHYEWEEELLPYTLNKLGLTAADWEKIWATPVKSFHDYATYYPLMKAMRLPIKVATDIGLLPKLLYLKYLG